MKNSILTLAITLAITTSVLAASSPVSPPASATGVPVNQVKLFANAVTDYSPSIRAENNNTPANAIGAADGLTVSLGDLTSAELTAGDTPGAITVEFSHRVFDGPGADLAVFENAFDFSLSGLPDFVFAELAFVEVSTNGADFARFPAISQNILPDANGTLDPDEIFTDFGTNFAGVDSTNIKNLAGIHNSGFGTPFDLAELASDALVLAGAVDLNDIRFVRMIDIPGTGDILDSVGNPIFDASLTELTGGFDLDAVGGINATPEPAATLLVLTALLGATATRRRS